MRHLSLSLLSRKAHKGGTKAKRLRRALSCEYPEKIYVSQALPCSIGLTLTILPNPERLVFHLSIVPEERVAVFHTIHTIDIAITMQYNISKGVG
jgi:hypothetical protein